MIPFNYPAVATDRIRRAQEQSERRRLVRAADGRTSTALSAGVIDAVGHGLIAIGNRLISHPERRRAA